MTKLTTKPCDRCGELATKRGYTGRPHLCRPCAELAITEAAEQMANKSGPVYDRWVEKMHGVAAKAVGGNL